MEDRTQNYLQGRFRDFYRRTEVELPPGAEAREWGFVPWTPGPDERFERHKALLDLGDIEKYLSTNGPKHVYFSSAKYERPAARNMDSKQWKGADLVFDIDAKDLPSVDTDEMGYRERLDEAHDSILRLAKLLKEQFAFDDMTIVFSGGQGYHIHIRDAVVQQLDGPARGDIVNFVKGTGVDVDTMVDRFANDDISPSERAAFFAGGWSKILYKDFLTYLADIATMDEEGTFEELQSYDGIGENHASGILGHATNEDGTLGLGAIGESKGLHLLFKRRAETIVREHRAVIDEPVTTDVNRLIRFPGTLHGGTGFRVTRIPRDELAEFDPFVDAVADTFASFDIAVDIHEEGTYAVGDHTVTVEEGRQDVPEELGVYLMAQGLADKLEE